MGIVCLVLRAYTLVVFARVVLEWIPVGDEHPVGRARSLLRLVTQPVLAPLRALLPPVRLGSVAVDLSPLVLILGLNLLAQFLC
ncbi:MAG: YggT family protein [Acidimicrobiia bacterium]|nr:YggT family protein [Acidimicrobiia bacterium]